MRKKTNKLLMKGQAVSVIVWMEMMSVSAGIGMLRAAGMRAGDHSTDTTVYTSRSVL